jgi:hypothetical protein
MLSQHIRGAMTMLCLGACGCSVMKELPRNQYAAVPERHDVRVDMRSGEHHEFERMAVRGDSLTGYERADSEGSFEEFQSLRLALDDVGKMSVRNVDWYRTGLIGGLALGVVLAIVLTQTGKGSSGDVIIGPCGTRPCP